MEGSNDIDSFNLRYRCNSSYEMNSPYKLEYVPKLKPKKSSLEPTPMSLIPEVDDYFSNKKNPQSPISDSGETRASFESNLVIEEYERYAPSVFSRKNSSILDILSKKSNDTNDVEK